VINIFVLISTIIMALFEGFILYIVDLIHDIH